MICSVGACCWCSNRCACCNRCSGDWARATGQCLSANAFRQLTRQAIEQDLPGAERTVCLSVWLSQRLAWYAKSRWQQMEKWVLAADMQRQGDVDRAASTVPGHRPACLSLTILAGEWGDDALRCTSAITLPTAAWSRAIRVLQWQEERPLVTANVAIIISPGPGSRQPTSPCATSPPIKRWYDRKAARKRHMVIAIKAVAHKLARSWLLPDARRRHLRRPSRLCLTGTQP